MSSKPNIPVKQTGDTHTATEFNAIVDFFAGKPDAQELTDLATTVAGKADTTALDDKVDKVVGKQLSDENYTLSEKNKLAGLESSKFKGKYVSLAALNTANVGEEGGYAYVDAGVGSDVVEYIWDSDDTKWVAHQGTATAETPASIKSKYESNADTNAFTDADKSAIAANTAKVSNATHTGDVTGATALTIAANAVTNAKLAQVATARIKGRVTAATGDVEDLTAAQVKSLLTLDQVDNTSDANKPVSTAQQTALNAKAPLASPALTGTPTAPTPAAADNSTKIATTAFVQTEIGTPLVFEANDFQDISGKLNAKPKDSEVYMWGKIGCTIKAKPLGLDISAIQDQFAMVNQRIYLVPVFLNSNTTITSLGCVINTAGVYTANNENRLALFEEQVTGTLTRIALTANDGNVWKTPTGAKTVALTSSIALTGDKVYWVACLYNQSAQTTAPQIAGDSYSILFSYYDSFLPANKSAARYIAGTTMPSSITLSATTRSVELPALFLI